MLAYPRLIMDQVLQTRSTWISLHWTSKSFTSLPFGVDIASSVKLAFYLWVHDHILRLSQLVDQVLHRHPHIKLSMALILNNLTNLCYTSFIDFQSFHVTSISSWDFGIFVPTHIWLSGTLKFKSLSDSLLILAMLTC